MHHSNHHSGEEMELDDTEKNLEQKVKMPQLEMRADLLPESFDEENRTIEVIFSVGAKGKRWDWGIGEYFEELSMKKSDVRLDRLNAGAPFLKNHSSRDLSDNLGVVEKAWIKNKEGRALIKLSRRDEIDGIIQDIKDKVLKNISVGYRVHKLEDVSKKGDETPTYRATDWEPYEISLVNIPFDTSAQIRSESENKFDVLVVKNKETEMTKEKDENETRNENQDELNNSLDKNKNPDENQIDGERATEIEPTPQPANEKNNPGDGMSQRELEKTRQIEIRKAVKAAGLDESFAEEMIEQDVELDQARAQILNKLGEKNSQAPTRNHNIEVKDMDNRQKRSEAFTRAIMHRGNPMAHKLQDGDNEFMGHSLVDTARMYLEKEGVKTVGMTAQDIAKRSLHSTSDFPQILADVANKELRAAYDLAPQTFMPFTRERSAKDFKEIKKLQLSDGTALSKVNEHGEYKRSTLQESKEGYYVEKYGKVLGVTWELIINDDLDAFTDIPAKLGRKARAKESELIWAIIGNNQLMADGKGIFHADHGNLAGAGAAISVTTLGNGRSAMRLQKDLDGEILNLAPRYLVVPSSLETVADQFVASITAAEGGKVNPFANRLQVISEGRLDAYSATKWYLMSDKADVDMIELARLDGRGPEIFTRESFNVDGMETKIRYVFGVKAIDHRGFYQNPGA